MSTPGRDHGVSPEWMRSNDEGRTKVMIVIITQEKEPIIGFLEPPDTEVFCGCKPFSCSLEKPHPTYPQIEAEASALPDPDLFAPSRGSYVPRVGRGCLRNSDSFVYGFIGLLSSCYQLKPIMRQTIGVDGRITACLSCEGLLVLPPTPIASKQAPPTLGIG